MQKFLHSKGNHKQNENTIYNIGNIYLQIMQSTRNKSPKFTNSSLQQDIKNKQTIKYIKKKK